MSLAAARAIAWIALLLVAASLASACAHAPAPAPTAATSSPSSPSSIEIAAETALLASAHIPADAIRCNRENRWGAILKQDSRDAAEDLLRLLAPSLAPQSDEARATLRKQLEGLVMWRMVRAVLLEGDNNNFGVLPLRGRTYKDASGAEHPVLLFRSGFTPRPGAPDSCFTSLLEAGGVRHVVNLFDGDIPAADLVAAESAAATSHGATYHSATDATDEGNASTPPSNMDDKQRGYGPWRDLLRKHYDDPKSREQASRSVARLIREQILAPGGAAPSGNLHVHCGGGMHRTGMIAGVIERCINHEPDAAVEAHYRTHVGWRDAAHPGGFEEGNVRFIREFDCGLLETK